MISSFWTKFLEYVEQNDKKNVIILSLLRQIRPVELTDNKIVLQCNNQGVKLYLEKKRPLVESLLATYANAKMDIVFEVMAVAKQKEEPLFNFQPSVEDLFVRSGLNIKYKFDNFAVSSSNQVAFAAAQAIAQSPGSSYNPLFLYGGVGVGKTHIAQAAARLILERDTQKKVFFCPGDQFTNELIESIRERSTPKFRRKYRLLDMIIVDDIQFIAGKQTVQEEFFHTFNSIVSSGGQVVLTSDRPPHEIKNLEDRLRSRFSGGLIVDVQQPDFELRTAILLIKAREKNIEIDMEAAKIIAEQVEDTRALEGALLSIYAKIIGRKDRIDLEVVDSFYQEKPINTVKKISPNDIIKAVCLIYNVKQSHIKSATRSESIAMARQIAMYLLRKELKMKFEEIAYLLKRKDHTTIMHGVEKVSKQIIKDPTIKEDIDRVMQTISTST